MPLDPLRRRFVVFQYWKHRTHPNLLAVLDLAEVPGLQHVKDILIDCDLEPCGEFYCPRCGPKWVAKQWQSSLNSVYALCGGKWPEWKHMSWVMLPGLSTEFDVEWTKLANSKLRKRISNAYDRGELQETIIHGSTDLSLRSLIHAHVWIYHPHLTRDQLRAALKVHFPDLTDKDVRPFWLDQHIGEAMANTIRYAFDGRPRETELWHDVREDELPDRIASRLVCLSALSKGGLRGFRISHGMRGAGTLVKQTFTLPVTPADARKRRRVRPQSEWYKQKVLTGTIDLQPETPEGVHQLKTGTGP